MLRTFCSHERGTEMANTRNAATLALSKPSLSSESGSIWNGEAQIQEISKYNLIWKRVTNTMQQKVKINKMHTGKEGLVQQH